MSHWEFTLGNVFLRTIAQSGPAFFNPVDHGPPGSSVHGILQAGVQSGLPFPPLRDLPNPEFCIGRWLFHYWATWESLGNLCYTRNWQIIPHRPNPACYLYLQIRFYWNTVTAISLDIVHDWFVANIAELRGCSRKCVWPCRAKVFPTGSFWKCTRHASAPCCSGRWNSVTPPSVRSSLPLLTALWAQHPLCTAVPQLVQLGLDRQTQGFPGFC